MPVSIQLTSNQTPPLILSPIVELRKAPIAATIGPPSGPTAAVIIAVRPVRPPEAKALAVRLSIKTLTDFPELLISNSRVAVFVLLFITKDDPLIS